MLDIATLGIGMDTKGLERGQRALDDIAKQGSRTADALDNVGRRGENAFQKLVNSSRDSIGAMSGMERAATALAAAFSFQALVNAAETFTKMSAQLKLATASQQQYLDSLEMVNKIAGNSQTEISAVSALYTRIANTTKQAGVSLEQVGKITETVSLGLKASGASTAEAESAMLQLSQAFASGVLRGEEFNAVSEAAFPLMKALADSMGIPVEELRKMASEGRITRDELVKAFTDPALLQALRVQAGEVQTIGGAFTDLKNKLVLAVGELDKATGSSNAIADAIQSITKEIDNLRPQLGNLANVFGPFLVGGPIALGLAAIGQLFVTLLLRINPVVAALATVGTLIGGAIALMNRDENELKTLVGAKEQVKRLNSELEIAKSNLEAFRNSGGQADLISAEEDKIFQIEEQLKKATAAQKEFEEALKAGTEAQGNNNGVRNTGNGIINESASALKKLIEEEIRFAESIQSVIDKELARTEALELQLKLGRELTDSEKQSIENAQKYGKAVADGLKPLTQYNDLLKAQIEAQKEANKVIEEAKERVKSIEDQVKAIEEETQKIGLSTEALRQLEIAKINDQIATKQQRIEMMSYGDANDELIAQYRKEIAELEKLRDAKMGLFRAQDADKAIQEQRRVAQALEDDLIKAFEQAFLRGGDFASSFKRAIEAQFAKMVLRPIIEAIIRGDAPNFSGGQSGGSGGGFDFGSLKGFEYSAGQQKMVLAGAEGLATAFGASEAAVESFTIATNNAFKSVGGVGGALNIATAAIGAYDAIDDGRYLEGIYGATGQIGGGILGGPLGAFVGQKIGETVGKFWDKTFGFGKQKDPLISLGNARFGFQNGQIMSEAENGAAITEMVRTGAKQIADAYVGTVKGLGGKAIEAFDIAYGAFTSRGTGQKFGLDVAVGGRQVFGQGETGMTEDAAKLAALRATFALLQETDFADNIDAVVRGIDETSASFEELSATLSQAQMLANLGEMFKGFDGALGALSTASIETVNNLIELSGGVENLQSGLSGYMDAFYTEQEKTEQLTKRVTEAFAELGVSMPKSREEVKALAATNDELFAAVIRLTPALDQLLPKFDAITDAASVSAIRKAEIAERFEIQEANRIRQEAEQAQIDALIKASEEAYNASVAVGDFQAALKEFRKIASLELRAMSSDFESFNRAIDERALTRAQQLETQRIDALISRPEINSLADEIYSNNFLIMQAEDFADAMFSTLSDATQAALSPVIETIRYGAIAEFRSNAIPKTPVAEFIARKEREASGGFAGIQIADAIKNLDQASVEFQEGLELFGLQVLGTAEITVEQFNETLKYLTPENLRKALKSTIDNGILEPGLAQIKLYLGDLSVAASKFADVAGTVSNQMGKLDLAAKQMGNIVSVFNEGVDAVLRGAAARAEINNREYKDRFGLDMNFNAASVLSKTEIEQTERAAVIARAAQIASTVLAETSFESVQDVIEKTVARFDQEGYAAAIIQISDALSKGKLTAEEYSTAFQQASRQFTGLSQEIQQAEQALEQARQQQVQRLQSAVSELESTSQASLGFASSIRDLRTNLLLAMTSPGDSAAVNGALFTDVLAAVQGGDTSRIGELSSTASAFVDAARASSSDYVEFIKRTAFVQSELQALESGFMSQYEIDLASLENSKAMLDSLTRQTDVLTQINESTLSVAEAVSNLEALQRRFVVDTTSVFAGVPAFANGGMVTSPTLAMIGEGRFNEAVVPLPDGRSIPVQMMGRGQQFNEALIQEIRALRAEVTQLRESNSAENRALVGNTAKATQILVRGTDNGTKDFAGNEI